MLALAAPAGFRFLLKKVGVAANPSPTMITDARREERLASAWSGVGLGTQKSAS